MQKAACYPKTIQDAEMYEDIYWRFVEGNRYTKQVCENYREETWVPALFHEL